MNSLTQKYNFILLPGLDGTGDAYYWLKKQMLTSGIEPENIYIINYDSSYRLDDIAFKAKSIIFNSRLPIFIIAESFAGPVGLALAYENPYQVKKLVLSSTFGIKPVCNFIPPIGLSLFGLFPKSLIPIKKLPFALLHELLMGKYAKEDTKKMMEDIYLNSNQSIFDKRVQSIVNLSGKWDKQWSKKIETDVLILSPTNDRLLSKINSLTLQKNLPKSFLVDLEGPHLLLQTNAPEAWKCIEKFEKIPV